MLKITAMTMARRGREHPGRNHVAMMLGASSGVDEFSRKDCGQGDDGGYRDQADSGLLARQREDQLGKWLASLSFSRSRESLSQTRDSN